MELHKTTPLTASLHGVFFGSSVAISGDMLAVSAPLGSVTGEYPRTGVVHLFRISDTTLTLKASLPQGMSPEGGENFGYSLAFSGHQLIFGAPFENAPESESGAVYIYQIDANLYRLLRLLDLSDISAAELDGNDDSILDAADLE